MIRLDGMIICAAAAAARVDGPIEKQSIKWSVAFASGSVRLVGRKFVYNNNRQ